MSDNIAMSVVWHSEEEVAEALIENLVLHTEEDIDEWRSVLEATLKPIHEEHGAFLLLVCTDRVKIGPQVANQYSQVVAQVAKKYARRIARYGSPGFARAVIAAQAIGKQSPVGLFDTRQEALDYLKSESTASPSGRQR